MKQKATIMFLLLTAIISVYYFTVKKDIPASGGIGEKSQNAATDGQKGNSSDTQGTVLVEGGIYQIGKTGSLLQKSLQKNSETIAELEAGVPAELLKISGDWCKVRLGDMEGYVSAKVLQEVALHEMTGAAYDPYPLKEGMVNSLERFRKLESAQLKKFSQVAQKSKNTLILKLTNGQMIRLNDVTEKKPEDHVYYCLVDFDSHSGYVTVWVQYYEGAAVLLVNRKNGENVKLSGFPLFSPDRKRFIAAHPGEAYTPAMFRVYNVEKEKPILEFELNTEKWTASDPKWVGNTEIEFVKNFLVDYKQTKGYVYWTEKMKRAKEQWTFAES